MPRKLKQPKKKAAPKRAVLSRAAILGAKDREPILVDIPQWGGAVRVRPLSGTDRDELFAHSDLYRDKESDEITSVTALHALYAIHTVIDDEGKKLFTMDDFAELCERNAASLKLVADAAAKSSGLTDDAEDELEKN